MAKSPVGKELHDVEGYASRWETLLDQITSRLDRVLGRAVESTGLSTTQCRALLFLLDSEEATMSMLSRGLAISLSAATGIVDRLIKKELVDRYRDTNDRRVVRVRLTENGSEVAQKARDELRRYTVGAFEALNEPDRNRLMSLMETIAGQISQVVAEKRSDVDPEGEP